MSLVFLFFLIDKYVFCNTADPTLPSIGGTVEDFNIAVSVMRLGFFLGTHSQQNACLTCASCFSLGETLARQYPCKVLI